MREVRLRYKVEVVDWSVMLYGASVGAYYHGTYATKEEAEGVAREFDDRLSAAATITEEEYQ